MKAAKFRYIAPRSLDEALQHLNSDPDAKMLAGGQSLMPLLAMRLAAPSTLIDLQHIPGLSEIEQEGNDIRIGARVTHRMVERSELLKQRVPILPAAARYIAHPQIRSRGTFGGSTAHADPSGEWPTVLLALGATMRLHGSRGEREVTADDFFIGPFTTSMKDSEILTHVTVPTDGTRWSFQEAAVKAGDYGLAIVAATARMSGNVVADARVSVGAAVGSVVRLTEVEDLLTGAVPDAGAADEAARVAAGAIKPISDIHGSSDYRRQLVSSLVRRAVLELKNGA